MDTKVAKKKLHQLIDKIEDSNVLILYIKLLEYELGRSNSDEFFKTSDEDLIARAKASLKSIKKGKTRNILEFKKDVEIWKKNRSI